MPKYRRYLFKIMLEPPPQRTSVRCEMNTVCQRVSRKYVQLCPLEARYFMVVVYVVTYARVALSVISEICFIGAHV